MNRLKKELGITQGAGLMSTSLLGTGIFVVPAVAASIAERWSLLAWILLIALVLPVAFTFALLGRKFPHAGGTAHIVGQAMGERFEKLTAFLFLLALPVCIPAGLTIATGFWHSLIPSSHEAELIIKFITLGIVLFLGLGGARFSGSVQVGIALLIVLMVGALWWGGPVYLCDTSLSVTSEYSINTVFPALAVMFWCFVGIEAFSHMGEEFKRPERDFPIALLLGVLLAGLVYWACSVVILKFGAYGCEAENTHAIPTLVTQLFGPQVEWLAAIIGYLACFASINIYIQGFSRLVWSMADEGALNPALAKLSIRKVPANAICLIVSVCALSTLIADWVQLPLDSLIRYANGNFVMVYLFCMLAGVKLLSGWQRGIAVFSTLLCFMVLLALGKDTLYVFGLIILFLGFYQVKARTQAIKAG